MNLATEARSVARACYGHATQDPDEFAALLEWVLEKRPSVVLEVGVYTGGTLTAWAQAAAPDALLIGVDANLQPAHVRTQPGQRLVLIEGDSTSAETLAQVREALGGRAVDFLFIDGCHEREIVAQDVANYPPFLAPNGLLAMHDVGGNDGVRSVWEPLCATRGGEVFFRTDKAHRMGIGVSPARTMPRAKLAPAASLGIAILTYGHPDWLEGLLTTLERQGWPDVPVRVFRDGAPYPYVAEQTDGPYVELCARFGVPLRTLPSWGCIQANAQQAFEHTPEDWVLVIQDDNLVTPGFCQHLFRVLDDALATPNGAALGLLQPPMWHATDLIASGYMETRDELLTDLSKLDQTPLNPGWGPVTEPRVYINAHGSAFLARRALWEQVGGFSPSTWCYDEDLSCKAWLRSPYSVFQVNGPPLVHGMPGRVGCRPQPPHNFGQESGWRKAWGSSRADADHAMRAAMEQVGGDGCPLSQVRLR